MGGWSLSAASDKQKGQIRLAWFYTKSVFMDKAVRASNIATNAPTTPHPVTHLKGFRTDLSSRLELTHPTVPMHRRMKKVGVP
jgi:hypothetical protein